MPSSFFSYARACKFLFVLQLQYIIFHLLFFFVFTSETLIVSISLSSLLQNLWRPFEVPSQWLRLFLQCKSTSVISLQAKWWFLSAAESKATTPKLVWRLILKENHWEHCNKVHSIEFLILRVSPTDWKRLLYLNPVKRREWKSMEIDASSTPKTPSSIFVPMLFLLNSILF